MKNKENCKIVQDLLPNYIDGLTSAETKIYIENHLNECKDCKNVLNNMQLHLNSNKKINNNDIDYLKKVRRKMYTLILILLIIITSVLCIFVRRFLIISDISNKISNLSKASNYYAKVCSYEQENLHIVESFNKDFVSLTNLKMISESNSLNVTMIQDKNKNETIILNEPAMNGTMYNTIENTGFFKVPIDNIILPFANLSFINKLEYLREIKGIFNAFYNNKNCYLVETWAGEQLFIEKNTGLRLRENRNSENSRVYDYTYEFDNNINIEYPNFSLYNISYE